MSGTALFRNELTGETLCFAKPRELLVAWTPDTFDEVLGTIERRRREGHWMAGYLSYEAGYLLEPKLRPLLPAIRRTPLACFGVFDAPDAHERVGECIKAGQSAIWDARAAWTREVYRERFERVHEHLRAGDCYQANLTFPIGARWKGDPRAIFDQLAARQPVGHAAYLDIAGPVILSRSPELFFETSRDGWIDCLPMKGTAPRGPTEEEDRALRDFLANDPKNQAENRMIVDLLRNDISRISETGTLEVPQLFHVDTYATLHQMVSRVRARLLDGISLTDILAALFPCGSITGAPKIRAMEILNTLEDGPRGIYCGSAGWIAPDGRMRFNVAIRTITLFEDGEAAFNVGGGVVFDSTADGEYDECLLKARFATGAPPASN